MVDYKRSEMKRMSAVLAFMAICSCVVNNNSNVDTKHKVVTIDNIKKAGVEVLISDVEFSLDESNDFMESWVIMFNPIFESFQDKNFSEISSEMLGRKIDTILLEMSNLNLNLPYFATIVVNWWGGNRERSYEHTLFVYITLKGLLDRINQQ